MNKLMEKNKYARPLVTVTKCKPLLLAGTGGPSGYIPDPQVGGAKEQDFFETEEPQLEIDVRKLYSGWEENEEETASQP